MGQVETINEGSTAYLAISFKDKNGGLKAPSSVSYRVDCLSNDQEIRADTAIQPDESIEIRLTPTDNQILNQANTKEKRLVTIKAVYGTDDAVNDEYKYNVRNLKKVE